MKEAIHPDFYPEAKVFCACGNSWIVGSTKPEIRTDVCSECHPFYTGKQKYVDTAGRLHTKVNLMEELKKIHRTAAKKLSGAPHETLLILDATTGQNALSQVRMFHEAVGVTGIILTKLDGTAKGGMALAVAHETGLPLRFLGVGEGLDDLQPFDPEAFVAAILD